jgi:hypothetical protein
MASEQEHEEQIVENKGKLTPVLDFFQSGNRRRLAIPLVIRGMHAAAARTKQFRKSGAFAFGPEGQQQL